MPTVFSIIGSSWTFFRKHTVFNNILLWMIIIPNLLITLLAQAMDEESYLSYVLHEKLALPELETYLLGGILLLALSIIVLWGMACVLTVGKRIIKSPAGRSRSSFSVVRKQAKKMIIPLFLTSVLRDCFTLFWLLLLVIPGIIYSIRTIFFEVIIACEGKEYREALTHSKKVVKGHSWKVFWYMLGIGMTIFIPAMTIILGVEIALQQVMNGVLMPISAILQSGVYSIATVVQVLATITLYKEIKKLK